MEIKDFQIPRGMYVIIDKENDCALWHAVKKDNILILFSSKAAANRRRPKVRYKAPDGKMRSRFVVEPWRLFDMYVKMDTITEPEEAKR